VFQGLGYDLLCEEHAVGDENGQKASLNGSSHWIRSRSVFISFVPTPLALREL